MEITKDNITDIFCIIDDFCEEYDKDIKDLFPRQLSYNRFVELESRVCLEMMLFLQLFCFGRCTGISFVDSTCVPVCHDKRITRNKVFKGYAEIGKSTMGWYFGF